MSSDNINSENMTAPDSGSSLQSRWGLEWWQNEVEALDTYILLDIRNNSAWNQVYMYMHDC